MVKFSVVIPVYNAAHTIRRCVESIANNTFKDVEIILIEDGSQDDSWKVCSELAEEFPGVVALHNEKNSGVSYTRNRGLEYASGQYTMFVDSDDWVAPNYYETFARVLEQHNSPFAICGYVNHDEKQNGRTDEFKWKDFEGKKKVNLQSVLKELYDDCLLQQLWNKAFITSVIKENSIRFDESISIGEDFRFILEYLKASEVKNVVLINSALYHYMRDQDGSLMYRVGYESVEEPLKNLTKLYELMGLDTNEIEIRVQEARQKQIQLYAYLIMHNAGMSRKEKKRLILALDSDRGQELYKRNRKVYIKEKVILGLKGLKEKRSKIA